MNYWIFQGNPKLFDVNSYLRNNETVRWDIRQSQYISKINLRDKVFIWRSDGGQKETGGIIGLCEIISVPSRTKKDMHTVDLRVIESRLDAKEGMLFRHDLKELPETMHLTILKMSQHTNYLISEVDYLTILNLWDNPNLLAERTNLPALEKYLQLFKG